MTRSLRALVTSRILRRILFGFGLVAALLSIGLVVTYTQFVRLNESFADLVEHDIALLNETEELDRLLTEMQNGKRGYLLTGDREYLAPYEEAVAQLPTILARARRETTGRPSARALLNQFERTAQRYITESAEPEIALRARSTDEVTMSQVVALVRQGRGLTLADQASHILGRLHNSALASVEESQRDVVEATATSRRVVVAIMVLALLAALGYGTHVSRDLGMALGDLGGAMEAMGHGGAPVKLAAAKRPDEIGAVARRFERMTALLADAEGSLRAKVREQDDTLATLRRTNDALARAMRVKSDFLATMSHELRTPLNAVIGLSALLLDSPAEQLSPRARQALATMRDSGEHLLNMLNDILDLAKLDAGRMPMACEEVDPGTLVRGCVATILPLVGQKPVEVLCEVDADLPRLWVDPRRLRQVLLNLLSNAVKFTDRGQVAVRARRASDGGVAVDVEDTGIGIAASEQVHLFEEFHQVATGDARPYGGTGLGLALSRRMARAMGGDITVSSRPGEGSTFTLLVVPGTGKFAAGAAAPAES